MDCTDIKVLLSGLVDDELDTETRYRAERHLAECPACRTALDEAETLNQLMLVEAERDLVPNELSTEFIGAVLEQTVNADHRARSRGLRWSNWIGWTAAAACLALAATIWVMDRQPAAEPNSIFGGEVAGDVAPARVRSKPLLISSVHDGDLPVETETFGVDQMQREDADALDSAAWLLDLFVDRDADPESNIEMIRNMAEYNDVVARLEAARSHLDPSERTAVLASELVIRELLERRDLPASALQELRGAVEDSDLSRQLTGMANRWSLASRSL